MRYRLRQGDKGRLIHACIETGGGRPALGLRADTPGTVAMSIRDGAEPCSLALTGGTVGHHVNGGFVEIDPHRMPGLYQLGVPDDVIAAGASAATLVLRFPNAAPCRIELDLVSFDPYDGEGLALAGFMKSTRNEHLTSVFAKVMEPSITSLLETPGES